MKSLTLEELGRTKDFFSFAVVGFGEQGGKLLVNKKNHMLYIFDGVSLVPMFEKYEDNFSIPMDELDFFVYTSVHSR